jgi:hypothetical protein
MLTTALFLQGGHKTKRTFGREMQIECGEQRESVCVCE